MPAGWYSVAPECVKTGDLPAGLVGSEEIMNPFKDCAGFFTFGPGSVSVFDDQGKYVEYAGASAGLWIITAIGFAVMILAFVAWVWLEHGKLTAQAERLRAAGSPLAPPSPPRPETGPG